MVDIVLSMLPTVWVNSMITSGIEPMEETYKDLIEYLQKLERYLLDNPIPKKKDSKDDAESTSTTSILKKDSPDKKPKFQF